MRKRWLGSLFVRSGCWSLILLLCPLVNGQENLMTAGQVVALPAPEPDERIAYGEDPFQFGEVWLPDGDGPFPVVVLIHGGCWLAEYDIGHIRNLAAAIADEGFFTWSLEYRRVGNPGGGWPGTFQDVGNGVDFLRTLAGRFPLDLDRVVAVGHSAGGHLALWLAGRQRLPETSVLYSRSPVPVLGVLGLAAAAELYEVQESGVCDRVIERLLEGTPVDHPERYAQASPSKLVPLGVRQILVNGAHDPWSKVAQAYFQAALDSGDPVEVVSAPASGHFEMIVPNTSTWPVVRDALHSLFH